MPGPWFPGLIAHCSHLVLCFLLPCSFFYLLSLLCQRLICLQKVAISKWIKLVPWEPETWYLLVASLGMVTTLAAVCPTPTCTPPPWC